MIINKQLYNRESKYFFIMLYFLCIANLLFMHYSIIIPYGPEFPFDNTSWIDNLSGVVFDVTMVYYIILFLTWGNQKPTILFTYIFTILWAFCNIIYSRFFHSYLSLSAIEQSSSLLDPIVIRSTLQGFRWYDLFFVFSPLIFYHFYNNSTNKFNLSRTIPSLFTVALFIGVFIAHALFCISTPQYRYLSYYEYRISNRHLTKLHTLCEPRRSTYHRGIIRSLAVEATDAFKGPIKLTESQKQIIQKDIDQTRNSMILRAVDTTAIQNIIFIIVESYMSFTSNMTVDGKEITPYLNKLRKDSSIYYNGHVQPNITIGESADGQYIYMTGLLPLRSVITISKAQKRVLPGLPKILSKKGMDSRMIIPTPSSMWNQSIMCKQYGFNMLFSCDNYTEKCEALTDQQVFEFAQSIDKKSNNPFFSVILTMTMHQPYDTIVDDSFILQDNSISDELKCYLNACHYMDKHLGLYIESLKDKGLYNNSLIIIAADHHVHNTSFGPQFTNDLPLYIINGGFLNTKSWHGICNQIDVYTTILDILNTSPFWCGLGHSLLSSEYQNSLSSTKWDISEWILQSDYFNQFIFP